MRTLRRAGRRRARPRRDRRPDPRHPGRGPRRRGRRDLRGHRPERPARHGGPDRTGSRRGRRASRWPRAVFEVESDGDSHGHDACAPTASGSSAATCVLTVTGRTRVAADRRAHRAEPAVPPVRGGHAHRGLGRRAGRDARPGPRHPQDHARPAGPGEVRGPLRRWRQPPDGPVRRRAGQGQPRRGGRRGGRRRSRRSAAGSPGCRSRSRSTRSSSSRRSSRRVPTWSCSTT